MRDFKIGDKVIVREGSRYSTQRKAYGEQIILGVERSGTHTIKTNRAVYRIEDLEFAPGFDTKEPKIYEPKAGDKVEFITKNPTSTFFNIGSILKVLKLYGNGSIKVEMWDQSNPNTQNCDGKQVRLVGSSVELKPVLAEFPESGWCEDGNAELGRYLAYRSQDVYIEPGKNGYGWNGHSYWSITSESGKPPYSLSELKHLFIVPKSEFPRAPKIFINKYNLNIKDEVRVCRLTNSSAGRSMQKELGKVHTISHIEGVNVNFEGHIGWNYNISDLELVSEHSELTDIKDGTPLFITGTGGQVSPSTSYSPHNPGVFVKDPRFSESIRGDLGNPFPVDDMERRRDELRKFEIRQTMERIGVIECGRAVGKTASSAQHLIDSGGHLGHIKSYPKTPSEVYITGHAPYRDEGKSSPDASELVALHPVPKRDCKPKYDPYGHNIKETKLEIVEIKSRIVKPKTRFVKGAANNKGSIVPMLTIKVRSK